MTRPPRNLVAGSRPWSRQVFDETLARDAGDWHFAGRPEDLSVERLASLDPDRIFFLHWSWKIPSEILERWECICFHMTDVPYGRGGSPLQNLIVRGHRQTRLTALRAVEALDAGPVYLKEDLSLEGSAEEIFIRATHLSVKMIRTIIAEGIEPVEQAGEATVFRRRTPAESRIADPRSLAELHDFVRMLDAEGYPRAFLEYGGFRFEFSRASLRNGRIEADVSIRPAEEAEP